MRTSIILTIVLLISVVAYGQVFKNEDYVDNSYTMANKKSTYEKWLKIGIAVHVIGHTLDMISTAYCINRMEKGTLIAREASGIGWFAYQKWGMKGMIGIKAGIIATGALVCWHFRDSLPHWLTLGFMYTSGGVGVYVSIHNFNL